MELQVAWNFHKSNKLFIQMRNFFYLALVISFFLTSCTGVKKDFEKAFWWQGHWQNSDDPSMFFSIGSKPVGPNEVGTAQFFISTQDSIYSNFHVKKLIDFNHRKKWKVIETNDNQFIKIKGVGIGKYWMDNEEIELYGPAKTKRELNTIKPIHFTFFNGMLPLIPDSILFVLKKNQV